MQKILDVGHSEGFGNTFPSVFSASISEIFGVTHSNFS
ncbi:hypothetical protein SynSYN20_02569 [Synechococcus sp. SYN20]|nr:hypothetical protein SynSYN20_02569 [Synechococcus sp. SYN20]